jgi:hypothetical protein
MIIHSTDTSCNAISVGYQNNFMDLLRIRENDGARFQRYGRRIGEIAVCGLVTVDKIEVK